MHTERGFALFSVVFILGTIGLFALAFQGSFVSKIASVASVPPQSQVAAAFKFQPTISEVIFSKGKGKLKGDARCNKPTEDALKEKNLELVGTTCVTGCFYTIHQEKDGILLVDSKEGCLTVDTTCKTKKKCRVDDCSSGSCSSYLEGRDAERKFGATTLKEHESISALVEVAKKQPGAVGEVALLGEEVRAAFGEAVQGKIKEQERLIDAIDGDSYLGALDPTSLQNVQQAKNNLEMNLSLLTEGETRIGLSEVQEPAQQNQNPIVEKINDAFEKSPWNSYVPKQISGTFSQSGTEDRLNTDAGDAKPATEKNIFQKVYTYLTGGSSLTDDRNAFNSPRGTGFIQGDVDDNSDVTSTTGRPPVSNSIVADKQEFDRDQFLMSQTDVPSPKKEQTLVEKITEAFNNSPFKSYVPETESAQPEELSGYPGSGGGGGGSVTPSAPREKPTFEDCGFLNVLCKLGNLWEALKYDSGSAQSEGELVPRIEQSSPSVKQSVPTPTSEQLEKIWDARDDASVPNSKDQPPASGAKVPPAGVTQQSACNAACQQKKIDDAVAKKLKDILGGQGDGGGMPSMPSFGGGGGGSSGGGGGSQGGQSQQPCSALNSFFGNCVKPACQLTATPPSVVPSAVSTISWQAQNAYTAYVSNLGAVNPSGGSMQVYPAQTTTYSMDVFTQTGDKGSCSATVTVNTPTPTSGAVSAELSCAPTVAEVGNTVALAFACRNATSATGIGFDTDGKLEGEASAQVTAPANGGKSVTHTLACTGASGEAKKECRVVIGQSAIVLVANPREIVSGATSNIGWATVGMSSCVISSPTQSVFTEENKSKAATAGVVKTPSLTQNTDFNLTCVTGAGGLRSATTTVVIK